MEFVDAAAADAAALELDVKLEVNPEQFRNIPEVIPSTFQELSRQLQHVSHWAAHLVQLMATAEAQQVARIQGSSASLEEKLLGRVDARHEHIVSSHDQTRTAMDILGERSEAVSARVARMETSLEALERRVSEQGKQLRAIREALDDPRPSAFDLELAARVAALESLPRPAEVRREAVKEVAQTLGVRMDAAEQELHGLGQAAEELDQKTEQVAARQEKQDAMQRRISEGVTAFTAKLHADQATVSQRAELLSARVETVAARCDDVQKTFQTFVDDNHPALERRVDNCVAVQQQLHEEQATRLRDQLFAFEDRVGDELEAVRQRVGRTQRESTGTAVDASELAAEVARVQQAVLELRTNVQATARTLGEQDRDNHRAALAKLQELRTAVTGLQERERVHLKGPSSVRVAVLEARMEHEEQSVVDRLALLSSGGGRGYGAVLRGGSSPRAAQRRMLSSPPATVLEEGPEGSEDGESGDEELTLAGENAEALERAASPPREAAAAAARAARRVAEAARARPPPPMPKFTQAPLMAPRRRPRSAPAARPGRSLAVFPGREAAQAAHPGDDPPRKHWPHRLPQ